MSIAQSTVEMMLPITNPDTAQEFYADRLGLPFEGANDAGELMFQLGGGSHLVLRQLPAGSQSKNTAMSFEVHGIESEISELEGNGVRFEDYDLPDLKTVNHICEMGDERAAWFADPDGNILCLHERVES